MGRIYFLLNKSVPFFDPYFEALGTDMFTSAMQRLGNEGVQVNKIRGSWETGTDSVKKRGEIYLINKSVPFLLNA